jgi:propionate CoA-transferase
MAKRGSLSAKTVKIPGILVDYIVVDADQRQTYATDYSPAYAGEFRVPLHALKRLPFDVRKIVARRAAMEITPGAICNLGAGISTGISVVATEEDILDRMVLTNEQASSAAPAHWRRVGASQNYDAIVDQPYQFDFYDGGGSTSPSCRSPRWTHPATSTSAVRLEDCRHRRLHQHQSERQRVVFSGTFTSGGLELATGDGKLAIKQEVGIASSSIT